MGSALRLQSAVRRSSFGSLTSVLQDPGEVTNRMAVWCRLHGCGGIIHCQLQ